MGPCTEPAFVQPGHGASVEIVFGNPGTTELPLMDAFAVENDIRYVLGLQEAATPPAFAPAADGGGRSVDHTFWLTPRNNFV